MGSYSGKIYSCNCGMLLLVKGHGSWKPPRVGSRWVGSAQIKKGVKYGSGKMRESMCRGVKACWMLPSVWNARLGQGAWRGLRQSGSRHWLGSRRKCEVQSLRRGKVRVMAAAGLVFGFTRLSPVRREKLQPARWSWPSWCLSRINPCTRGCSRWCEPYYTRWTIQGGDPVFLLAEPLWSWSQRPGWSPWSGTLWRWHLFLPPRSTPRLSGLAAAAPSPLHSTCGLYLPGTREGKRSRSAWQRQEEVDMQRNGATQRLWSCR